MDLLYTHNGIDLFDLFSAGTIPLSNIAIGLKVSASMYAVFVALAIFGKVIARGEKGDKESTEEEHR